MEIREESPDDHQAIYNLTKTAFAPMPFSQGNEAECVSKLRADGDLTISLVAIQQHVIIGHVAFSPVFLDEQFKGWYGLGPISVAPASQKKGIGTALIQKGFAKLKQHDALGCLLIGNPDYYGRFGFIGDGSVSYRDLPHSVVQWLAFTATKPSGTLKYSPGLE